MATPLEMIKQGILANDMSLISQAYTILTNEVIVRPQPKQEQSRAENYRGFNIEDFKTQTPARPKNNDNRRQTRTESIDVKKIRNVGNMFEDVGSLDKDDERQRVKDKPLYQEPPVKRREAPKTVHYSCDLCNQVYSLLPIHVALVKENDGIFICDECKRKNVGK